MKLFLINDNESSSNIGCRATSKSIQYMINESDHKLSGRLYIDQLWSGLELSNLSLSQAVNITKLRLSTSSVIEGAKNVDDPKYVYSSLRNLYRFSPKNVNEMKYLAEYIQKNNLLSDTINRINESDMVLINAEGSFWRDAIHPRWMVFWAYYSKKVLKKRVEMTNMTLSLDDDDISSGLKQMVINVFPKIDNIIFREPKSYLDYESRQVSNNIRLASDVAFVEPNEVRFHSSLPIDTWRNNENNVNLEKRYICLGGNSIYPHRSSPDPPIKQLKQLVEELSDIYQVLLIPSRSSDERYFREVTEATESIMLSSKNSPSIVRSVLSGAIAYIGGRFHPAVFAISEGTPVIGMTTKQNKMKGLLSQAGLDSYLYDSYNFENDIKSIISDVDDINTNSNIIESLDKKSTELKELAWNNIP